MREPSQQPNEQQIAATMATMRDVVPRMWWNIYQGCLQQGFDPAQSFALLQTHILSTNTHGIQPPGASGPESDQES